MTHRPLNRPRHYKKQNADPPGHQRLGDLLTINEAAALWFKERSTIEYHIQRGNLAARQSGSIWLISKNSLIAYYGHSPLIQRKKS